MAESAKAAVFLSYASQDTEPARRIAEALRGAGLEVWFDQDELRGGDEWDRKIKNQIRTCALFVPVISANTQARPEGYFRLEWHLAEQRSLLIAKGRAFIVPVGIDETKEGEALVPDAFLAVQWSRPAGDAKLAQFVTQVQRLLASGVAPASSRQSGTAGKMPALLQTPEQPSIPDYELLRQIGRGSYGDVWLARGATGLWRAVKIVWRERFADAEPFEREWRGLKEFAAISLGESSQMALLHVGRNDEAGFFFYVMELADDVERGRAIDPANYVPLTLTEVLITKNNLTDPQRLNGGGIANHSLGVLALTNEQSLLKLCGTDRRCPPSAWSQSDSYDLFRSFTTIGLIAGAAGFALGVPMLLAAPRGPAEASPPAAGHARRPVRPSGPVIQPYVSWGGAGVRGIF